MDAVDVSVKEQWENETKSLDEWNFIHGFMRNPHTSFLGKKLRLADFDIAQHYANKAKRFESPSLNRAKARVLETEIQTTRTPNFSLQFPKDNFNEHTEEEMETGFKNIDTNLVELKAFCEEFYQLFVSDHKHLGDLSSASMTQLQALRDQIGEQPGELHEDYHAPSLWNSFILLVDKVETLNQVLEDGTNNKATTKLRKEVTDCSKELT